MKSWKKTLDVLNHKYIIYVQYKTVKRKMSNINLLKNVF